jgi:hypothetical protein
VPLVIVVAAGLSTHRAGLAGLALAVAIVTVGAGAIAVSASEPKFGAEDWRGAVRALGPVPAGGRAIVLWPDVGRQPFLVYRPAAGDFPARGATAGEIVLVTVGPRRQDPSILEALSPPPPFRRTVREDARYFTLVRFDTRKPTAVTRASLVSGHGGLAPALLYER